MLEKLRKILDSLFKPPSQKQGKKSSKYGHTLYTSKPLEEAEKDAGEKLYKISDGVYVNQTTYDFIHSEETPKIEDEALDVFSKIEIQQANTLAAVWAEADNKLVVLSKTANPKEFGYAVLDFSGQDYTQYKAGQISFDEDMGEFRSLAIDSRQNFLLLTFKNYLAIWDFGTDTQVIRLHVEGNGLIESGFYPADFQVWSLVMNESYSACEWLRWEYFSDFYEIYEMENRNDYGRGASLHPSGLLMGVLWNAHACGYYIHSFISDEMRYYREPAADRREYENYSPSFSPDGKHFAFVANPYLAMRKNYCKICIYELETGKLIREFYTGFSGHEAQSQFVHGGKRIAFYERESIRAHVFNPENGKRLAVLKAAKKIRYFNGHRLAGYYALAHDDSVTVYYTKTLDSGNQAELEASALALAKRFIESNQEHLAKPNDWETEFPLTNTKIDFGSE